MRAYWPNRLSLYSYLRASTNSATPRIPLPRMTVRAMARNLVTNPDPPPVAQITLPAAHHYFHVTDVNRCEQPSHYSFVRLRALAIRSARDTFNSPECSIACLSPYFLGFSFDARH
jgi:hypothetical protein